MSRIIDTDRKEYIANRYNSRSCKSGLVCTGAARRFSEEEESSRSRKRVCKGEGENKRTVGRHGGKDAANEKRSEESSLAAAPPYLRGTRILGSALTRTRALPAWPRARARARTLVLWWWGAATRR